MGASRSKNIHVLVTTAQSKSRPKKSHSASAARIHNCCSQTLPIKSGWACAILQSRMGKDFRLWVYIKDSMPLFACRTQTQLWGKMRQEPNKLCSSFYDSCGEKKKSDGGFYCHLQDTGSPRGAAFTKRSFCRVVLKVKSTLNHHQLLQFFNSSQPILFSNHKIQIITLPSADALQKGRTIPTENILAGSPKWVLEEPYWKVVPQKLFFFLPCWLTHLIVGSKKKKTWDLLWHSVATDTPSTCSRRTKCVLLQRWESSSESIQTTCRAFACLSVSDSWTRPSTPNTTVLDNMVWESFAYLLNL